MRATAEIIDFRAVRERRQAAQAAAPAIAMALPPVAWVPVWFFAPVWMCLPAQASEPRDG